VVEPGVVDDRSALAFTNGHCHSLALALHRCTGGEMVGLTKNEDPYDHILTRNDDGRLIDIGGARSPDELTALGGRLSDVDSSTIPELCSEHGWVRAEPELAAGWVDAILARVAAGTPHVRPRCFTYDFELSAVLDVHVEWSGVDGGERLTAFGRELGYPSVPWARCAVMTIKPDENGERLIDFTQAAFDVHLSRFEQLLRTRPSAILENVRARREPEQPLREPHP
jgi:hypothetical protein